VEYQAVLPPTGHCVAAPLSDADADIVRAMDIRLRAITADVARDSGAGLLRASAVTRDHHVCAAEPWMNGYSKPDPAAPKAFYHPTLAGMTAVAEALDRMLPR
jgi:hypothetical protein